VRVKIKSEINTNQEEVKKLKIGFINIFNKAKQLNRGIFYSIITYRTDRVVFFSMQKQLEVGVLGFQTLQVQHHNMTTLCRTSTPKELGLPYGLA